MHVTVHVPSFRCKHVRWHPIRRQTGMSPYSSAVQSGGATQFAADISDCLSNMMPLGSPTSGLEDGPGRITEPSARVAFSSHSALVFLLFAAGVRGCSILPVGLCMCAGAIARCVLDSVGVDFPTVCAGLMFVGGVDLAACAPSLFVSSSPRGRSASCCRMVRYPHMLQVFFPRINSGVVLCTNPTVALVSVSCLPVSVRT